MGTNYYWTEIISQCECCGNQDTINLHIGKSSLGWKFLFNGTYYKSWGEWDKVLESVGEITDEYGEVWEWDDLVLKIEDKQGLISAKAQAIKGDYDSNGYWVDPLGYEFAKGEFS
tara:strand:- start:174 stop:518 length:345 start_codon:yes stop_codon:yes gene_type:complete